jgi:hypothetical protein
MNHSGETQSADVVYWPGSLSRSAVPEEGFVLQKIRAVSSTPADPVTECSSLAAEELRISSSLVVLVPVRILTARPKTLPHQSPNTESYTLPNLSPRSVVPAQRVMVVTDVTAKIPQWPTLTFLEDGHILPSHPSHPSPSP